MALDVLHVSPVSSYTEIIFGGFMSKGAKRSRKAGRVERALVGAARDLGVFLGTLARQVDSLAGQREQLTKQLRHVQSAAGELLGKLGDQIPKSFTARRRRTVAAPTASRASGRKRRRFSAATRRKMAAAQKARWAKARQEKP